jgi:hypothetical protein
VKVTVRPSPACGESWFGHGREVLFDVQVQFARLVHQQQMTPHRGEPMRKVRADQADSSFGANPLEQTIRLAKADRVAVLEVHRPTGATTQVFRDIPADRAIEITEFADSHRPLKVKPVPQPK